jgi:ubiquinone/menaquinone biosynthesis C-methylase UbiE
MVNKDQYLLPRDDLEKNRLNLQNTIISRHFNGSLPKSVTIGTHDRILEIGCGTGAWSLSLASQLPSTVTFEATDISPDNFPRPSQGAVVPPNVHFSSQSVLSLPEEWTNSFDIVYQRLILSGITKEQWTLALKELRRVTKPGGHVVLVEIDPGEFTGPLVDAFPATRYLNECWGRLVSSRNMLWHLKANLSGLLADAGFEVVSVEDKIFSMEGGVTSLSPENDGADGSTLADDTLCCLVRLFQSFKGSVLAAKFGDEEMYDRSLKEMTTEWKGADKTETGRGFPWVSFDVRKPLED